VNHREKRVCHAVATNVFLLNQLLGQDGHCRPCGPVEPVAPVAPVEPVGPVGHTKAVAGVCFSLLLS